MTSARVVIVGAGFGGLSAARKLGRAGYDVTIVDRHPYTTFQPLLYQVATGGLNAGDVTYSLRSFAARLKGRPSFRRASVTGIDKTNRQVLVDDGKPIPYDYLILANGVTTNHFGIPGAQEHTRAIYTRAEALRVRDSIFGAMERLAAAPEDHRSFTAVVVGGGATGVEMAGTLAEMRVYGVPAVYPELSTDQVKVVLVEMAPQLLTPFPEDLQRYTLEQLREREVDVRLDTAISRVHADRVEFKDGTELETDLVIWAAGIGGYDVVKDWGVPTGRGGRILVDDNLLVQGEDRIFAVGDCAVGENLQLPQLAQPAMQMGEYVAKQVRRLKEGHPLKPFQYQDKGTMATIGRHAAVADIKHGPQITGFPAWMLWGVVHLYMLLGGRNRIQAMLNLGIRYLSWPGSATAIVGDVADTPAEAEQRRTASESESSPAVEDNREAEDSPVGESAVEDRESPAEMPAARS